MAADRQQAFGHGPVAIGQGALHQGVISQVGLQLAPQCNTFEQRAALVQARQAQAQCCIHVEMGVHKRWGK